MARIGMATLLAAGLATLVAGEALAADLDYPTKAPVVEELSPWMIRVRALGVIPESGATVNTVDFYGVQSHIPGSSLSYSDSIVPELDISYFFTENLAAELVLGTTKSTITAEQSIAGLGEVGTTWILPPTLMLQYHFNNMGAFKPYVGVGVNYTIFYNQDATWPHQDLSVNNAWGVALQVGFDWMFDRHWGINFDVKKLYLEPDFDVVANGALPVTGTAQLNPWLVATGVTYRF